MNYYLNILYRELFNIIMLALGVVILAGLIKARKRTKKYTQQVQATCVSIEAVPHFNNVVNYLVLFEYDYNKRHIKASPCEYRGKKPKGFKKGDTVNIYVNPEKPDRFIVGKKLDAIDIVFGTIAIILIITSIIAFVSMFGIK